MRYGRYGWPHLILRIGLGLTFAWIGVDMLRHPETWIGYIPEEALFGMTREGSLRLAAFFDILLGVAFFVQAWQKVAAWLAVLHLVGILVMHRIDAVLIRDVGLLGAALALALWPSHYHRRRQWWNPFSRRKKRAVADDE